MKKLAVLIMILCFICMTSGCNGNANNPKDSRKIIAVSIVPQASLVEAVCGDNFKVLTLIPPGASPETYELTPNEMKELENASIYFSIGVPAEEPILPTVNKKTKIVSLHEVVAQSYPDLTEGDGRDPHIWLSPKRVKLMVEEIAEALGILDSENKALYSENAEKYIESINSADKQIKSVLEGKSGDSFITFHPAFGYFADEYGLNQYALEEHGKEATAKRLIEMADLAKQKKIKVIFYQSETSSRQAEAFAEEIGGRAVGLEPLSADYIGNLNTMAKAFAEAVK